MGTDQPSCPHCGTPMAHVSNPGIWNECRSCGTRLFGLAPFERLLQEGVGVGVWRSCAETPQSGPNCPYCSQAMRQPGPAESIPKELAVCRLCQQVLVPSSALEWMNQSAQTGAGGAPVPIVNTQPTECANCGAPYEPDDNGCCRFCHAQIAAIPAPVILEANPYDVRPASTGRVLEDLANALLRPNRF